jgi:hypothetical protein
MRSGEGRKEENRSTVGHAIEKNNSGHRASVNVISIVFLNAIYNNIRHQIRTGLLIELSPGN